MQDRPAATELLAAVRGFLQQEVLPTLADHRLKFRTLIAANVLAVVERELQGEEERLRQEWQRLGEVGMRSGEDAQPPSLAALRETIGAQTRALCSRIRAGEADEGRWGDDVRTFARWTVEEKLRVSNPRYLAAVLADWEAEE